jgi:hypothetical protein
MRVPSFRIQSKVTITLSELMVNVLLTWLFGCTTSTQVVLSKGDAAWVGGIGLVGVVGFPLFPPGIPG